MKNQEKEVQLNRFSKDVLALFIGVLIPFLIVAFLTLFAWGIGAIYKYAWGKLLVVIAAFIIPCLLAGYLTIKISGRNNLYLLLVTFLLLILIALINNDFRGFGSFLETLIFSIASLLLILCGGFFALRKKTHPGN